MKKPTTSPMATVAPVLRLKAEELPTAPAAFTPVGAEPTLPGWRSPVPPPSPEEGAGELWVVDDAVDVCIREVLGDWASPVGRWNRRGNARANSFAVVNRECIVVGISATFPVWFIQQEANGSPPAPIVFGPSARPQLSCEYQASMYDTSKRPADCGQSKTVAHVAYPPLSRTPVRGKRPPDPNRRGLRAFDGEGRSCERVAGRETVRIRWKNQEQHRRSP